jgi:hypothetical protein
MVVQKAASRAAQSVYAKAAPRVAALDGSMVDTKAVW